MSHEVGDRMTLDEALDVISELYGAHVWVAQPLFQRYGQDAS